METPPPTVEQRHRNAAADLIEQRGEWLQAEKIRQGRADKSSITVQAFARFDTERTAELEREIAALREAVKACRHNICGYNIGGYEDAVKTAEVMWKELQRIDNIARAILSGESIQGQATTPNDDEGRGRADPT